MPNARQGQIALAQTFYGFNLETHTRGLALAENHKERERERERDNYLNIPEIRETLSARAQARHHFRKFIPAE